MRFPPSLLDDIRARLPVSQVVARKVSLKRAGREMKGLSPFKQEKTPSFFVNDHKGSWFDFSSGQNGDIFKFVMLTDGLSFPEAVERLAEEAGVVMPKPSAREEEYEDERTRLYAVLDASARFFEAQLTGGAGLEARRYLTDLEVTIRVEDPLLRQNTGTFQLAGGPDGASVTKSRGRPDLVMTVRDLGAIYLGGTSLAALVRAGIVTERTKGAAAAAGAAFAWSQPPFCPDSF